MQNRPLIWWAGTHSHTAFCDFDSLRYLKVKIKYKFASYRRRRLGCEGETPFALKTQRRLLVPFLYIGVTNGDICCNEAQKARLGGAPGTNPQLTLTLSSYHVNNLEKDLVRDANGKRLRVKAPVRIYLICNPSRRLVTHVIYTSLPRSPFVVKVFPLFCHFLLLRL
ncbi:hypothetical protein HKD37_07G018512 [Glycine soja]